VPWEAAARVPLSAEATRRKRAAIGCFASQLRPRGPQRTGEDRALVAALRAQGRRVLRASSLPVVTSARRRYRAPAGFGHHLTTLGGTGSLAGAP